MVVGEDEPACGKQLCDMADLKLGSGLIKKVYGKMLIDEKTGILSATDPSSVRIALVTCDLAKGSVPSGALDAEVVICKNPDSFKKFVPSVESTHHIFHLSFAFWYLCFFFYGNVRRAMYCRLNVLKKM